MNKILLFIVFVFSPTFIVLSQNTEERILSTFDKINVTSEFKVFLSKGNEEKVKIISSGIETSEVHTNVNGKTLDIELSRGIFLDVNIEIYITYKVIREITVGASCKLSVQEPLIGDKVIITANTGGEVTTELNLRTIDVKVGQGASIRLNGRTGSMDAKINTGGILAATELQSDSAYIRVGSAGIAKINALYLLDANVRTGGTLTYTGKPKEKKITTGIGATINEIE